MSSRRIITDQTAVTMCSYAAAGDVTHVSQEHLELLEAFQVQNSQEATDRRHVTVTKAQTRRYSRRQPCNKKAANATRWLPESQKRCITRDRLPASRDATQQAR